MWLRVAPHPASSGFAGDGSSSRLESRILQHFWRSSFRSPRSSALPVAPLDESPSCPGFCIFRPCRRWIFELPRISHPSTHPALRLRVAPQLNFWLRLLMSPRVTPVPASSGCAGDGSSSCPESRVLRRLWCWRFGFPLSTALPVAPPSAIASCPAYCTFRLCLGFKLSGCPESFFPWRRLMVSRVASVPASSGFAVPASSGRPESRIYGWVNDDFPVLLELCILGLPADESSWPIGRCKLLSNSGCIDNLTQT